jgi:hypothetical protein
MGEKVNLIFPTLDNQAEINLNRETTTEGKTRDPESLPIEKPEAQNPELQK